MKSALRLSALVCAAGMLVFSSVTVLHTAVASSHREAPLISQDPVADQTDTYFFISPQDRGNAVLVGNFYPLIGPGAGPNYYRFGDDVVYALHIDNDGDAEEDVSYAFTFETETQNGLTFLFNTQPLGSPADANVRQRFTAYRVEGNFPRSRQQLRPRDIVAQGFVAPPVIGEKSQPDYASLAAQAIVDTGHGTFFTGPRDDPFFVDLNVFDLLNLGAAFDSLAGANVQSIVAEVPIAHLTADGGDWETTEEPVLGIWGATYRQSLTVLRRGGQVQRAGRLVQVSRLGNPLVNEVVVPLAFKDFFNNSHPEDDADTPEYAQVVLEPELARLFRDVLGLDVPTTDRQDLFTVFLTGVPDLNQPADVRPAEMIRLNVGIDPADPGTEDRLGVFGGDLAGYPNGRRLADDVTDIAIQAVAGKLVPGFDVPDALGDGVDANDKDFSEEFPYLALPHLATK